MLHLQHFIDNQFFKFFQRSLNEKFHLQNDIKNEVSGICERLSDLDFNSKEELTSLSDKIKSLCQSVDTMEKCIDHLYAFAVKSKWNAHVAALFCNSISDITVQEAKFRTYLLRKLQTVYKGKISRKFIMIMLIYLLIILNIDTY